MIFVYNFLQLVLLAFTFPILLLIILGKEKYRTRIGKRMGLGLKEQCSHLKKDGKKVIWIHSLSVGEVTSAIPLVKGINKELDVHIVFSVATKTGMEIARKTILPHVHQIIAAPLDLLPVTNRFINQISPDMFILVETDFWPNWLHSLRQKNIPLVLVNGRISLSSFAKYQKFNFFFTHLFNSFSLLSMQTEHDALQMQKLGVPHEKIKTLGNLKYDTFLYSQNNGPGTINVKDLKIPADAVVWVCGSTHPGEEEFVIEAYFQLQNDIQDLFLILAPRNHKRGEEIQKLFADNGLQSMQRSKPSDPEAKILILDTIGELADCYQIAKVALIGGSLLDFGGHNPLEAAAYGVPVLFGPHMEDFLEISEDLQNCGGAVRVASAMDIGESVRGILCNETTHERMSNAARELVARNAGVIQSHIQEIHPWLSEKSNHP